MRRDDRARRRGEPIRSLVTREPGGALFASLWSLPDRTNIALYLGASLAWHGLGARSDDTIGVGFGYFTVGPPTADPAQRGHEVFVEAFYKWRLTKFMSLQPDVQFYRHPGGDGRGRRRGRGRRERGRGRGQQHEDLRTHGILPETKGG